MNIPHHFIAILEGAGAAGGGAKAGSSGHAGARVHRAGSHGGVIARAFLAHVPLDSSAFLKFYE